MRDLVPGMRNGMGASTRPSSARRQMQRYLMPTYGGAIRHGIRAVGPRDPQRVARGSGAVRCGVTESLPVMNSRARNGESSTSACENFTFHGQTDWEMCRYTRFEIALTTGNRTVHQVRMDARRHPQ
jgi:hypothetical protein